MVTQLQSNTINQFSTTDGGSILEFLQTTYTVYKRQNFRLLAMKSQIIAIIIMPLLWLLIMAPAFDNLLGSGAGPGGLDYITFITPGILIQVTLFSSLFGSITLFYDRDSGYLKNYLIAPISRIAIFLGYTLGLFTRIFIQVTVILVISALMGADLNLNIIHLLGILLMVFLVTIFIFGFSVTVASRAQNVEAFQAMIMPVSMPLMFLSPIMYPVDALPKYLRLIAHVNPVTYGVETIRGMIFGDDLMSDPLINTAFIRDNVILFNIFILLFLGAFFLFVGSRAFLRSLNN